MQTVMKAISSKWTEHKATAAQQHHPTRMQQMRDTVPDVDQGVDEAGMAALPRRLSSDLKSCSSSSMTAFTSVSEASLSRKVTGNQHSSLAVDTDSVRDQQV